MNETTKVSIVTHLAPEILAKFESQLPKPVVDGSCTPQQAGYLLGIQFVISRLREGIRQ